MTETFVERRQNPHPVKAIIVAIVGPLVVTIILGYVAMHTTISKLTLLAEYSDKRIMAVEQTTREHDKEYRAIQLLLVKHTQMLETIYTDFMAVKRNSQ